MIIIIGHAGHGKSTLIKAIKQQLSNIECKEINSFQDLIDLEKQRQELMEKAEKEFEEKTKVIDEFKENYIENYKKRNKKGKQLKNWNKKNFWD